MKTPGSKSQLFVPEAPGVLPFTSTLPLASLNLPVGVSLDLHGAVSILPERTTLKNDPDNLVGDYHQQGEMVNVGTTLRGLFR